MFCWCLLEGSPNTGKITFLSKGPGYWALPQGCCSPLLEVKRISTKFPKILQAKRKWDGSQRHGWIGASMSPHSCSHNKDNSCCASWLPSLPPHLWQSLPGLSWGAKSKHNVSIIYITIIQSVQYINRNRINSLYMISNFQFAKLLEATFISTLQETSTCFLLYRVTQVSTEGNKDYIEKKKLALLFAVLFNIAKTSRYTQQNVCLGPQVATQKPFVSASERFFPSSVTRKSPFSFLLCYLSRILPANRIDFCVVWYP